jgi:hypothetical protein
MASKAGSLINCGLLILPHLSHAGQQLGQDVHYSRRFKAAHCADKQDLHDTETHRYMGFRNKHHCSCKESMRQPMQDRQTDAGPPTRFTPSKCLLSTDLFNIQKVYPGRKNKRYIRDSGSELAILSLMAGHSWQRAHPNNAAGRNCDMSL